MSSPITKRYFWSDAPSPAHELIAAISEHNNSAYAEAKASIDTLTKLDTKPVYRGSQLAGFLAKADLLPSFIRKDGTCEGEPIYVPYGRTTHANSLRNTFRQAKNRMTSDGIVSSLGLAWMVVDTQTMRFFRSAGGWRDDRFWVQIPFGGEDQNSGKAGPDIPGWLTEAREWEMKRWFDIGRAGVEALQAAA